MKKQNAYDRLKSKSGSKKINFKNFMNYEETYFAGAAVPAVFIAGIFDGGISIALAYGAHKLFKQQNGG